jgi:hypothetical protein
MIPIDVLEVLTWVLFALAVFFFLKLCWEMLLQIIQNLSLDPHDWDTRSMHK